MIYGPSVADLLYRVHETSSYGHPKLDALVERLCQRTGIDMSRVLISNIPIPNDFAYGSPIAGTRVAITVGLLNTLEDEEVEAILGHELGHMKHRDVQSMLFASVLPAIVYYLAFRFSVQSILELEIAFSVRTWFSE